LITGIPKAGGGDLLKLMEVELEYFPRLRSQGVAPPPLASGKCPTDVVMSPRQFDFINTAAAYYFITTMCEPLEYHEDEPATFNSLKLLASSWTSTMLSIFSDEVTLRQINLRNLTPGEMTLAYMMTGLPLEFPEPQRSTLPSCVPLLMFSIKSHYRPLPAGDARSHKRTNRWMDRETGEIITTPHPYTQGEFLNAASARKLENAESYIPARRDSSLYHFSLDVPDWLLEAER